MTAAGAAAHVAAAPLIVDWEAPAAVIDIGADTIRAGYSGEEVPRIVAPSTVVFAAEAQGGRRRGCPLRSPGLAAHLEAHPYLHRAATNMKDSEALAALLGYSLEGLCAAKELPVLLSTPNGHCKELRAVMAQILFEQLDTPAVFMLRSAALNAFAFGKVTALVVDLGAETTSVAPVCRGEVMQSPLREAPYAGKALDSAVLQALARQNVELQPSLTAVGAAVVPQSRQRLAIDRQAQDLKESICFCSHSPLAGSQQAPAFWHVLPDGQRVDVAKFSQAVPETLLMGDGSVFPGAAALVAESVGHCDEAFQREALGSVLLCGGSSLFVNFRKRFEAALSERLPKRLAKRSKVVAACEAAAASRERRHAAWLGGSVLASSSPICTHWVSRREYEEHGARILQERCP
eukprot:gnl/TRDRNA2_/TRDRNA2_83285_c0_seq1.p1 gnl/TRDRNA2_/TRDRNA2_83285_c0~~gnl/TRDRNA2_/TRDRNA2_83285_c0_seq1.p1  ORF type:complete len:431 (+),score=82.86 gnl/TRDRNA2_/TRDRNA2_83285_c0_seq1:79-1293(+)